MLKKRILTALSFLLLLSASAAQAGPLDVAAFFDGYASAKEKKNDFVTREYFREFTGKEWKVCGLLNRVTLSSGGAGADVYVDVARQVVMARPLVIHQLVVSDVEGNSDTLSKLSAGDGVCAEGVLDISTGLGAEDGRLVLDGFMMTKSVSLAKSKEANITTIGIPVVIKSNKRLSDFFEKHHSTGY